MQQTGTGLSDTFKYGGNGTGELTKVVFPYQGELRWTHTDYTTSGNLTVREVTERRLMTLLATIDPGQSYQKQSKTEQTLDGYGNRTQMKLFDFGNLVTPASYLTGVQCRRRYIFNRRTAASVRDASGSVSLANNSYDQALGGGVYPESVNGSPGQQDIAGYGWLHTARGERDDGVGCRARLACIEFARNPWRLSPLSISDTAARRLRRSRRYPEKRSTT